MAARYVFDSNIFIGLERRQPRDLYPSVWKKLDELMDNGTIISSMEVLDELSTGDDDLLIWAKNKKESFLPSDVSLQQRVRKILAEDRTLVEGGKKKNNADPFVIALAQEKSCIVVTEETRSGNPNVAPKIPDICEKYGIPYINFVGFARDMQLSF